MASATQRLIDELKAILPPSAIMLTCACCGGPAPALRQWYNRDTGYGCCGGCAAYVEQRYGPEEVARNYGQKGVHWFAVPEPPENEPDLDAEAWENEGGMVLS
jgi:hypothetical protein